MLGSRRRWGFFDDSAFNQLLFKFRSCEIVLRLEVIESDYPTSRHPVDEEDRTWQNSHIQFLRKEGGLLPESVHRVHNSELTVALSLINRVFKCFLAKDSRCLSMILHRWKSGWKKWQTVNSVLVTVSKNSASAISVSLPWPLDNISDFSVFLSNSSFSCSSRSACIFCSSGSSANSPISKLVC